MPIATHEEYFAGAPPEARRRLVSIQARVEALLPGASRWRCTANTGAHHESEAAMIEGSCHCGAVTWKLDGVPESATACNCTVCRRYGVLWAYDYEGEGIHVAGPTKAYTRGKAIEFHFCPSCGCVAYWRAQGPGKDGRRRIAVNLRLTEPDPIAKVPIDHFDGLDTFDDLPRDGRCVGDYWF